MFQPSMHFRLQNTDGPAQYGMLHLEKHLVEIPNLLFVQTKRFHAPSVAQMIVTNETHVFDVPTISLGENIFIKSDLDEKNRNSCLSSYILFPKDLPESIHAWTQETWPLENKECIILSGNINVDKKRDNTNGKLFIVSSSQQLYQHPKEFVTYLTTIRENIMYDSLVYFPAIANPTNSALLVYCGIDLLDTTQAILAARNNIMFFPTGNINVKNLKKIPCNCPSCSELTDPSELSFSKILQHNYYAMHQEMQLIQSSIMNQNLRRLVELRIGANPQLITILRYLDQDASDYLEKRTSLSSGNVLNATTFESTQRPEIIRFQQRVLHRYEKPKSASVLLLLPCSMKKPYSFSQSHRKFHEAIFSSKNPYCIHELILTSPLGLVPRELELVYPASSYDIPVTGTWYADEQMMLRNLLQAYLHKNKYDTILVHLPKEMTSFLKDILPEARYSEFKGSPNSSDAVTCLTAIIKEETKDRPMISGKKRWREHIHSLASYQFTKPLADSLLKDTSVIGKYPYLKIMDLKRKQLGMTTEKRGFISLTLDGGERLLTHEKYFVHLTSDFTLKGSVFVPGIKDADPLIRRGDEVLVLQNNSLKAVGIAMMNGEEMMKRAYGEAVKVRHKKS